MKRTFVAAAAVLVVALLVAACGSSSKSSSSSSASTGAAPAAKKQVNIAYLSFAVANSYDAPMLAAAQAAAKDAGANLTVLDANNDPKAQFSQLQNAAASGKYNAIIVQPIFGTGLTRGVQDAISKGIKVVNMDQILGRGSEHRCSAGGRVVRQRRVRAHGHRQEARHPGRPGMHGEQPESVQRRLPL